MKRSEALEPLSHDHYEGLRFAAGLRRAQRAGEDAALQAEAVPEFWRAHLVPHFAEEEALVVPVLEGGAPSLARQLRDEHRAIGALVERIEREPAAWDGPLGAFADALTAHIRFEERHAFPAAERLADGPTLAQIGAHLHDRPRP